MVTAMTIAGSDSGGGAGIQADLKTFHAHGVYGTSVLTALTAQNTCGVSAIHPVPPDFVAEQYVQVMIDIGADAAKTGMLVSAEVIAALAEAMDAHPVPCLVVDPVMISKAGVPLLEDSAVGALVELILPRATVVTPNLQEAAAILDARPIETLRQMSAAAEQIRALGAEAVLIKGGHLPAEEEAVDLFYDGSKTLEFRAERLDQRHTHGTGCTYSAAITAGLARGLPLLDAVGHAKTFVTRAIRNAPGLGKGIGPLNHFVNAEGTA